MRTVLVLTALALATAFMPGATLAHITPGHGGAFCTGVAPTQTSCTTGQHLYTWNDDIELDLTSWTKPNYNGTLEARLTQGHNVYTLRCDFTAGVASNCATSGTYPTPGFTFVHDCFSYDRGTTTLGGSGEWGCRIYHIVA